MARALLAATAVVGTLALAGPSPAAAQGGAGLYAPFPQGTGSERGARVFFGGLIPTSVSADELSDGVVLPAGRALRAAPPGLPEPSRRAGLDGNPDGGTGWLVGAMLAVLAALGLVALALRGRPSEAL